MIPNFAAPYQYDLQSQRDRASGGTYPLLFVSLTYRFTNRLFVFLLEALLGTLVLFSRYRGDVVVIINSNLIQDVIVLSCLAFAFAFRFRGWMFRLVLAIKPRTLSTRRAKLVVILFVVAIYNCSALSHEKCVCVLCATRRARERASRGATKINRAKYRLSLPRRARTRNARVESWSRGSITILPSHITFFPPFPPLSFEEHSLIYSTLFFLLSSI